MVLRKSLQLVPQVRSLCCHSGVPARIDSQASADRRIKRLLGDKEEHVASNFEPESCRGIFAEQPHAPRRMSFECSRDSDLVEGSEVGVEAPRSRIAILEGRLKRFGPTVLAEPGLTNHACMDDELCTGEFVGHRVIMGVEIRQRRVVSDAIRRGRDWIDERNG